MNNLQIFKNKEFGNIRIIEKDGQPLFCGSDVAKSLGYDQPHKAISQHCRYGTKHTVPHPQSAEKEIEMGMELEKLKKENTDLRLEVFRLDPPIPAPVMEAQR